MGRILEIVKQGHPVLQKRAEEVSLLNLAQTQNLIDDLFHTVNRAQGMGIAAPQVGVSKRIFIMSSRPCDRYPQAPEMEPLAIINPEITWRSTAEEKDWEGCLSVPDLRGLVSRHSAIGVRYCLRDGTVVEKDYQGFLARVFQHEWDHLEGVLFPQRVASPDHLMEERKWKAMIAAKNEKPAVT